MNQQGSLAIASGIAFENLVEGILKERNIDYIRQYKFTNVYNKQGRLDFFCNIGSTIAIECKFQKVNGSVSEKLPFSVLNLQTIKSEYKILLLGGDYFDKEYDIFDFISRFANNTVLIFYLKDFLKWLDHHMTITQHQNGALQI